jgi:diguanylate cyclase (GGDEF)-like protein/PAS domain S-box-containing protein
MNAELIFSFLFSIFVLMGVAAVYAAFPTEERVHPTFRKVAMGFIVGGIGITLMGSSYTYTQGVFYDARSVVISVSGMFLGAIPTLVGGSAMVITRIIMGGDGTVPGTLSIVLSGIVGILWRRFRLKADASKRIQRVAWWEFYLVALATSVVVVLSQLALPSATFTGVLRNVALPVLVIYPIGQLLVSFLMMIQRNQYFIRQQVQESEEQFRRLFLESEVIQMMVDPETGAIVDVNDKTVDVYGYRKEELLSFTVFDLNTLPRDEVLYLMDRARNEDQKSFLMKHRKKDGSILDIELYSGPIRLRNKTYLLSTIIDKTEQLQQQKLLQEMDERFRAMLLSIGEGIIVIDESQNVMLMNMAARNIIHLYQNAYQRPLNEVFRVYSKQQGKTLEAILQMVLQDNHTFRSDASYVLLDHEDNDSVFVDFTLAPIIDETTKENRGAILVLRDMTNEHKRNEEIRYISQHDHLTGLYNRYFFEAELKRLDTKRQLPLSIIMGDVNGLKLINDSFTHLEGDKMLQKIASILEISTRHEDVVCRWGGDEFAILLPQTTEAEAMIVLERIKTKCQSSSFQVFQPSLSLGLATKTETNDPIYGVIKVAEERMYREKLQEGKSMRNSLIATLEATLYEKSMETKEHAENMIDLARQMATKLHFNQDQINTITLVARLHDIGKITIPDTVLQKPGPLTDIEWEQIRNHPETGSRIVQNIPELTHIAEGILCHHERYDGSGYPQGLKGDDIPLMARVISIVDAYEVMTNGRSYRPAVTHDEAIDELNRHAGTQFDPELVPLFVSLFE